MKKKLLCVLLAMTTALTVIACGSSSDSSDSKKSEADTEESTEDAEDAEETADVEEATGEEVIVPIIFTTGTNDANDAIKEAQVAAFNEEYDGIYEIQVEWLAGAAEDYRTKLKMLNSSDSMPSLIAITEEPAFYDLLVENNKLLDLTPYLEADAEWSSRVMQEAIDAQTNDDGTLYIAPVTGVQQTGIYYNKELLDQVGVTEFPTTWEDFWAMCDKLKEAGIPALSLHTTETAWCPMLMATASMAQTEAGLDFMDQQFPDNFDTPEFRAAMEVFVKEFEYTTSDAVGGTYAMAANHFLSGNTAMIANGPWMMPSLSDESYAEAGFADKIGYATFPESVMISSFGGYSVSLDQGLEAAEGAVEFLKFLSRPEYVKADAIETGSLSSAIEITDEEYESMSAPMKEYVDITENPVTIIPNYQTKWDPVTQNDVFGRELPSLIAGDITMDEFVEKMNEGVAEYKADVE